MDSLNTFCFTPALAIQYCYDFVNNTSDNLLTPQNYNKNMNYKHTQIGYLVIVVSLILVLYFGFIIFITDFKPIVIGVMVPIMFILLSFLSLQVKVDKNYLRIKYGYGIYRKKFALSDIVSVRIVKNHWYYGWGIRVWFWPKMWIFNISGFDAIELKMKNGNIY